MAFFRCKPSGEKISEYAQYILICNCDIEYTTSSWWDIRRLKSGNKFLLIVNNIYYNNTQNIIDNNNWGYQWLSAMIGIFNSLDDAINAFNNSDILSYYPYQKRTDYYFLYYGGHSLGWDTSLPYYASKTFNFNNGLTYTANPHPTMKPKI